MKIPYLFARFNLALAALMMTGCTSWNLLPLEQRVLEQVHSVKQWAPERLEGELPVLEQAYAQRPNTVNRLRLAVSLGFGRCHKCDSARALRLFKETLQSSQDNSVVALASLSIELLESKAMMAEKNSALVNQQQRINELQQKLNDLTLIEESLHLRE